MPGHGRAMADSHLSLPVVDADESELEIDVAPFRTLNNAPMGMTAHIVYTTWNRNLQCSLSPPSTGNIIRSEGQTSELHSQIRTSYAAFSLKKKKKTKHKHIKYEDHI